MWHVRKLLDELPEGAMEFEQEYDLDFEEEEGGINGKPGRRSLHGGRPEGRDECSATQTWSQSGDSISRNFETKRVLEELEAMGIEEGYRKLYDLEFDYYK